MNAKKLSTFLLSEVDHDNSLLRPKHKLVVVAPSRERARATASLEDPERPALWLDPERSRCELLPNRKVAVVCKNFGA